MPRRLALPFAVIALAGCDQSKQQPAPPPAPPPAPVSAPAPPAASPSVYYACADGSAVRASYPDPDTAVVEHQGRAHTLKTAISASGARYIGEGLQWWTKGWKDGSLAPLAPGETIASAAGIACKAPSPLDPIEPPAPGTPGGLPDDRTPISETPFTPQSAQGAAEVAQTYFGLIEAGKHEQAWQLWADGGKASGMAESEFAQSFSKYGQYHANVGAPGKIEGTAGSLYVEVMVQAYGRLASGEPFVMLGPIILRRVNNVPGATAEQLQWRIASIGLKPVPQR